MSRTTAPRFRFYGTPANYLSVLSGELSTGRRAGDIRRLELEIAGFVGHDDAVVLPQARLGVYLATRTLVTADRDEVILSPYTIHDVVNMVIAAGGRPVFVDIDPDTCNISPAAIGPAITQRTAFVMVTHLHGLACDMAAMRAICEPVGVPVVEDAAQALGARSSGSRVGGIGLAGIVSFGRAKNVNGFFGGAVVSSDTSLVARMRAELEAFPLIDRSVLLKRIAMCAVTDIATAPPVFRFVTFPLIRSGLRRGRSGVSEVVQTERNPVLRSTLPDRYARLMRPSQARTVLEQLPLVDARAQTRHAIARIYHAGLQDVPGVTLPPWRVDGSHAYMQFPIRVDDRDGLVRALGLKGLDVPIQHLRNTADLDIFAPYRVDCPNARGVSQSIVLLPTYPGIGSTTARAIVGGIRRIMMARSAPMPVAHS